MTVALVLLLLAPACTNGQESPDSPVDAGGQGATPVGGFPGQTGPSTPQGGGAGQGSPTVSASGDRGGLILRIGLRRTSSSFVVDTAVQNTRDQALHLDADQCGRITEVVLARTVFEPEGEVHTGSVEQLKELVLGGQRFAQNPDRFHPRRVTGGSGVPNCERPDEPVALAAGATIEERWELPFDDASGLKEVGSEHTVVRAEVVESEAPDSLQFLDIIATGEADDVRQGRNLRIEQPSATVIEREATAGATGPSLGQLFDRMIEEDALAGFIAAQPAGSWRQGDLVPWRGRLAFTAVTTAYEKAITATVSADGRQVDELLLPGAGDRTRVFERRRATLPPAVALIPEENGYVLTDDLIADRLVLPSGQVVADAYFTGESEPDPHRARPGSYPVHVTLARYPGTDHEKVALASLVVSGAPTVKWEEAYVIAVDGGTAAFTSAEGHEALGRLIEVDGDSWESNQAVVSESLTAHEWLITETPIDDELNVVTFTTGFGDGGYPVFVGLDGDDNPTRFVIDFGLVLLDWPRP